MIVKSRPFQEQKPGTSGLRKSVSIFQQQHYLENFVQAIFDSLPNVAGARIALGGDGRYHNSTAIQSIIKMASANGVAELVVGLNGILSTPAASHIIRKYELDGGLILSASHNPGGPNGDFGIKYNIQNGGPAPESLTNEIYKRTKTIDQYKITEDFNADLSTAGVYDADGMRITVINSVDDYLSLLENIFDFDLINNYLIENNLSIAFDAMHAVTGPYATALFTKLSAQQQHILMNAEPLEDFGGGHPDPSLEHAHELAELVMSPGNPIFGGASDGDGDRNMIVGEDCFVSPSDSLAILAANATLIPAYSNGLSGLARSMPTSCAVDRVAESLGIPCFETPTGWKFFGNLLDAGKITFCGEESFGTSSDHVREKDGMWAILFWLNLIAARKMSVKEIVSDHWKKFGRNAYLRYDYEAIDSDSAQALIASLINKLPSLVGSNIANSIVITADEFTYHDPIDQSISEHQGIRILLENDSRIIFRLSGTGTQGATLRVYLEALVNDPDQYELSNAELVSDLVIAATELAKIEHFTGRTSPSVIT